jgi:imidazoleglycerol-phosphate dehydratase
VGDKKGIRRYGHAYVPLDEALSPRGDRFFRPPGLVMNVPFKSGMIGTFDTQLTHEFFQGFVNHALCHPAHRQPAGRKRPPPGETVFKAFARALRAALELDPRSAGIMPSTKGSL